LIEISINTTVTSGNIIGSVFNEMLAGFASTPPIIINPIIISIPHCGEVIAIAIGVIEQTAARVSLIGIIRAIPTINGAVNVLHGSISFPFVLL
jgi:hypothetical protein